MEQIAALMLLIGCSDDLSACQELPAPSFAYETVAECEQEVTPAMMRYSGEHPQVLAQCFEFDADLMQQNAEILWDINPSGELVASVEALDGTEMAARQDAAPAAVFE